MTAEALKKAQFERAFLWRHLQKFFGILDSIPVTGKCLGAYQQFSKKKVLLMLLKHSCSVTGLMKSSIIFHRLCKSGDASGTSEEKPCLDWFPQGSQLAPFGCKLYAKPQTAIAKNIMSRFKYAHDTQLFLVHKSVRS